MQHGIRARPREPHAAYGEPVQDSSPITGGYPGPRPLRRDAARNRELILGAATAAFAEEGVDVGYDEIARRARRRLPTEVRAGVGVGTVYRRFPQRGELISALFEVRMSELVDLAESAARQPDAWTALSWSIDRALDMQAADRGLAEILAGSKQHGEDIAAARTRLVPALTALLHGAKRDGSLREDVEPSDLGALMVMLSAVSTATQPRLYRRRRGAHPRRAGTAACDLTALTEIPH